jgi:hypothetical protein
VSRGDFIKKMGRPTDDPKNVRLEIQLTRERQEKLGYCVKAFGLAKAEIIRQGIDEMYQKALNKK